MNAMQWSSLDRPEYADACEACGRPTEALVPVPDMDPEAPGLVLWICRRCAADTVFHVEHSSVEE